MLRRWFVCVLAVISCISAVGCSGSHAAGGDRASLMQAARAYGQRPQSASLVAAGKSAVKLPASVAPNTLEEEDHFERAIQSMLNEWNFDGLEKAAHEARLGKDRLRGGAWKIFIVYEGVASPPVAYKATNEGWVNHLATLKQWMSVKPESATARIALAEAYVNYAWFARGHGFADTVSDDGAERFQDRLDLAASALAEAAQMKETCPFWYEVAQEIATGQGWRKEQMRQLFEEAIAFEPGFYHYYREYTNYLLPKWYGHEGDVEKLANEAIERVGGTEGAFLYFEIASVGVCQCGTEDDQVKRMSWPGIKAGYEALAELYGVSDLKLNRFAYMAYEAGDKPAAQEALEKIGNNWDDRVWKNAAGFEKARSWAAAP